jgi:hypothetical protein
VIRLAATMRCPTVLPVGSNFLVEAIEPRDTLTGAAVTLNSIAVDIRDARGELVAAYVGEGIEPGRYAVCVPYGAPLVAGETYAVFVTITAMASDGTPLHTIWRPERVADYAETIRA